MSISYDEKSILYREDYLIKKRRQNNPQADKDADTIGFALSGGGIRSATFCLGIFQALAKPSSDNKSKIHQIDYLSTVSGGGYFGSFLGRLFNRRADVEKVLCDNQSNEIKWLRENGRYLSPNGGGDLLKLVALTLRNWVAVQIVMASLVLAVFFLLHWLEYSSFKDWLNHKGLIIPGIDFQPPNKINKLWLSNWLVLPVATFFIFTLPPGWAYWLVIRGGTPFKDWRKTCRLRDKTLWISPILGLILITVVALVIGWRTHHALWLGTFGLCCLTWVFWAIAEWKYLREVIASAKQSKTQSTGESQHFETTSLYFDDEARHWLTNAMKYGFGITIALLVLAGLDSLAKSLALQLVRSNYDLLAVWTGVFALSGMITPFVDRIVAWFRSLGGSGGDKLNIPLVFLGQLAGIAVIALILVSLDTFSYILLWDFPLLDAKKKLPLLNAADYSTSVLAGLLVFSWLFGRNWSFLNRSSLHALYSSRLARAYLGASNPERHIPKKEDSTADKPKNKAIVDVLQNDDVTLDDYFAQGASHGAPLHLINVTVNQTVDSASQIQQQDRKGYSLSIGPAGFCLGGSITNSDEVTRASPFPDQPQIQQHTSFKASPCEDLSLGQMVAISGAAFSTGMGGNTGIGLSLLTGFFNLRLGYWWDAHGWKKDPCRNDIPTTLSTFLAWLFPVQSYIFNEYMAHFHGPCKQLWNLSDGGHFENTGAYELIRRRVPKIVVIDAEADPDYQFEGLGNLVRKVRIDFDAEIEFLSATELEEFAHAFNLELPAWLGSLEDIHNQNGKAYAAIARVSYPSSDRTPQKPDKTSLLLYIKASLIGTEPRDIQHFHEVNPSFPQQSTADQFFDEAQWESYRKLGEHIGEKVFTHGLITHLFI